jgi:hypothetical protein
MKSLLTGIVFSLGLFGCSDHGKLTGTDTGNPMVTASVKDASGNPLKGAQVIVYSTSVQGPLALDTLIADENGRVSLSVPANGEYGFEVYWKDSLGTFLQKSVENSALNLSLIAGALVDFPVDGSVSASLAQTGRALPPGSVTKIPPGLWLVNYTEFGTGTPVALPPLQVQVDDAQGNSDALMGLSTAALSLSELNVTSKGYLALSMLPSAPLMRAKIEMACEMGGYTQISACQGNDDCRAWQWESDWVTISSGSPVFATVITGLNGALECVIFPDAMVSVAMGNGVYFYTINDVRVGP